jgi:hypothetical protein
VVEAEEDAALFCAHGFLELDEGGSGDKHQASTFFTASANLNLDESQSRVFLNTGTGDDKLDGWYLDTGTTHHMTGRRELFIDLDTLARGTVRFGDESKVEIYGIGSIIFEAKTGEHRVLHGIYYIQTLRNSIMSLGQLDEGGSKVEIEDGMLRIWDQRKRLLVKVCHSTNRLYILPSTRPSCTASPRARMMRCGAGMSASAISTLTRFVSSPGMTWCAGCWRWTTSANSATCASSPSTAAPHSRLKPSTARRTR